MGSSIKKVWDSKKAELEFGTAEKEPSLYEVIILNDDFTPMTFVVEILERFFFMQRKRAVEVMMVAHADGYAVCGKYSKDIAETKLEQVLTYARTAEHPLNLKMEGVS